MAAIIRPTVSINGTAANDLIHQRVDAKRALEVAIDALKAVTPNGRDYPGDNDHCVRDRETHYARIAMLRDLQAVLLDEALAIQEQTK